jgi:hypothetical protein
MLWNVMPLSPGELYEQLKPHLGENETKALIEYVDGKVKGEVATKEDLHLLREDLHQNCFFRPKAVYFQASWKKRGISSKSLKRPFTTHHSPDLSLCGPFVQGPRTQASHA